ncbi:S8 family serine peptidase [Flavobacterium alkalisoli]|uniref:S8 family serine peptidase n=1 Tax=Flavobacterium alkalisoli TaxID=2602769 RepID=UPI003A8D3424
MKKQLFILFLILSANCYAQEDAWAYFNDKPDAEYYLANPLEMLSQRALDRRTNQGIALDELDVPIHEDYVSQTDAASGITVMAKSKWLNAVHVRGTIEDISALTSLSFVQSIEFADKTINTPGRPAVSARTSTVNNKLDIQENYDYGMSTSQIDMLNGQVLHQQDYTGEGMIIAVMDSGFPGVDTAQPFQNLFDNNLILGGYNFVDGSNDIYTADNHGTYVLSTMGGFVEGALVGTAPNASYYLFITEDTSSENPVEESYWVEAAEVADSLGVDVINTSLGYYNYDNPNYNYPYESVNGQTAFMTRGADIAFSRGMIVVISAGNNGNNADPYIEIPADAFNVLTVGSVSYDEARSYFSSIGPTGDGRIKPDVMAQGSAAIFAKPDGTITFGNGTSFSSPITAGLVTCLWQAFPEKTNTEIMDLVKGSADRFTNPDFEYGYGIPDFAFALNELTVKEVAKTDFILYPNPAKDVINIAFPDDFGQASITIYNSLGQVVINETITEEIPLSIKELTKGIYSYIIQSENKTKSGKLIKE